MELKIIITATIDVENLAHWQATTLDEAAENQQCWLEDGTTMPAEVIEFAHTVTTKVEPVP